jgi:hypothetical protein
VEKGWLRISLFSSGDYRLRAKWWSSHRVLE